MLPIVLIALGFWHYEPSMNELQYSVPSNGSYQTCGAIGKSSGGMFYADVMASGGAESSGSTEFNTIDAAERHVEQKCRAR